MRTKLTMIKHLPKLSVNKFMIEHLSCSSVQKYQMCPLSWKHKYIDRITGPTSTNLIFGSAFHAVIENAVIHHDKSLIDLWKHHWKAQVDRNTDIAWDGKTFEALEAIGLRMVGARATKDAITQIVPLRNEKTKAMIETRIEFTVEGVPVPVIGFVDIITDDGIPCDFKTAARAWAKGKEKNELQPLIYLPALKEMGLYDGNLFRYYVFVKQNGSVQKLEHIYSDEQIAWGLEQVRQVWNGIEAGVFPAASSMGWWCSKKWCEYWETCKP